MHTFDARLLEQIQQFINVHFQEPLFSSILHKRHFVLDQPASIDKIGLSARFDRLHFNKARQWARNVPGVSVIKTDFNYQILIHGELLEKFLIVDRAIRAIVFRMYRDGLFILNDEDLRYKKEIDPSDYLFTIIPISQVEFAFDFLDYQIPKVLRDREYTLYSDDYKYLGRHSMFYFYDRVKALLQRNQHPHDVIRAIQYRYRAEFQLNTHFCPYLNLENLRGTTEIVTLRFLAYLAGQFREWGPKEFFVQDLSQEQFFHEVLFMWTWSQENHPDLIRTPLWNTKSRESLLMASSFF